TTIRRMLGHLQTLLEGIVAHPEYPLAKLPLLTEAEQRLVLVDWNATTADYPRERCIHELIEEQTGQTPDAAGLTFEGQSLTYRQLDQWANRLAHHLRDLGVGPEERVALCVERSPGMVVAILGVLKAGGAYVPLDTTQPTERLAYMLRDAAARVLLTQRHLRAGLPPVGGDVIDLDEFPNAGVNTLGAPTRVVGPDNLAYVIYTSGSTGRPKGVLVEHRGLTNVVLAQNKTLTVGPDSRVLQFVSLHFDAAQAEIFRTLVAGGTLCLAKPEALLGERLLRLF